MKRRVTQPFISLSQKLTNLLTVDEVATAIRRHPEVVRRQARDGRLPGEKIGRVWFFRPERLAEAGFSQFIPRMQPDAMAGAAPDHGTSPLVRALSEAGLEALQRLDRDAIFNAVGSRLAEAGLSTFIFLMAPGEAGLTVAFQRTAPGVELMQGHGRIGTFIPFQRIPVLHRACTSLRPQYIGDPDELVGRVAMVLQPGSTSNARELSQRLNLNSVISAPLVVGARAVGAITVTGSGLREEDLPALMAFANQTASAMETARLLDESRRMEEAMVLTLAGAIELRVALRSRGHEHADLAERFAAYLGLDPIRRRRVRYAALLQDLGKLHLPDSILRKRGRLDSEERALMMTHPAISADVLKRFLPLTDLAPLVRSHHEWFNGEGYPDGLKGEAIPLETRIVSIVNAFFSVTFDVPFKNEKTIAEGLQEMANFGGINLDATLTNAFAAMFEEAKTAAAPWYQQMAATLLEPHSVADASGPRDILTVADSRELRIVYRVAQETSAVLDIATLLQRIVTIIRDVMGYYMVSILLPSEVAGELRVGAQSGYGAEITGVKVPSGHGITGWVFTHGVPQVVPDVQADGRYIAFDHQVRSELAFPLVSRSQVVGVLNAESQHADAFSEADVALMSAVGSQLGSLLEVAQLHDTLKREASHDPLTRLNNRRLFLERVQEEIGRAGDHDERFSLVFLDVNELKRINDTYGHLAGDALLREVSNALVDAVRGEDLVARYGGDEFVVLLPATPATAAAVVAQRISEGIARHRFMAGRELLQIPGVSLGVATFPEDGTTIDQLLAAADTTLYLQKRRAAA